MGKLSADLQRITLLPHRTHTLSSRARVLSIVTKAERDALLEQVKVYGRDPTNAEPIFTKEASRTQSRLSAETDLQAGHRNLDTTCLQQPFLDDVPKCAPMPGECHAPQSQHKTDVY